jgi:photosystem II stability/assembly factor-like uncharacterized protein
MNRDNFSDCNYQGVTPINTRIINYNNNKDFCDIVFINSTDGWKLKYLDCAMYSQSAILYKTNDSGNTWSEINHTESVPLESKTGMTFINSDIGWITTQTPKQGYIGLFRTLDGGLTWNYQDVDIPNDYKECTFITYPPVFFSENDGVLFTYQSDLEPLVYITHDNGDSWVATAEKSPNGNLSWIFDADNGFQITFNNKIWVPTNRYSTWEML